MLHGQPGTHLIIVVIIVPRKVHFQIGHYVETRTIRKPQRPTDRPTKMKNKIQQNI